MTGNKYDQFESNAKREMEREAASRVAAAKVEFHNACALAADKLARELVKIAGKEAHAHEARTDAKMHRDAIDSIRKRWSGK